MKTSGRWIGIALMILMMTSVQALAQNGGSNGNGYCVNEASGPNGGKYGAGEGGFGNGECQTIRSRCRLQILSTAEPVTITGVVAEAPYAGFGLIVDTGEAEDTTTVYGIGPQWYWDMLGVTKPDVGEEVEIQGLKLTFSDETERIIATTITILGDGADIEDIVVPLRDEDGRPLWRRGGYGLDSDS